MSYQEFKEAYIEALLWSETDYGEDGSGDNNFEGCAHELDDNALAAIDSSCGDFWQWIVYHRVIDHPMTHETRTFNSERS